LLEKETMDVEKSSLYTAKRPSGVDTSAEVLAKWREVRDDGNETNWVLGKVVTGTTICALHASGAGGLIELLSSLSNDDIFYGGIRCAVRGQTKFFHLFLVGEEVGGLKKGKGALWKNGILQSLEGGHGEISVSDLSTPSAVSGTIRAAIGGMSGGATEAEIVV